MVLSDEVYVCRAHVSCYHCHPLLMGSLYLDANVLHGDPGSLFIRIHRVQLLLRAQGDIGKQLSLLCVQLHIQSDVQQVVLLKPHI